jgi:type I restriction enzyme S subunit
LQDVVPDWVSFASQLSYARDYFFSAASQTVNLASLNSTQLKGLPVPLAPVNEQKRILEKVKALLAQADIIEQAASVSLRRAEQVDQSILARAFRGELE